MAKINVVPLLLGLRRLGQEPFDSMARTLTDSLPLGVRRQLGVASAK